MRRLFLATALSTLSCGAAHAQAIYKCPQLYPGKDAPPAHLTGASMRTGDLGEGWIAPPMDEAAEGGYDERYVFADDEQAWLVCSYGARKRISGRFHDGHEWNQRMEGSSAHWRIRLAPKLAECTVQTRERKAHAGGKGMWIVTSVCQ